MRESVCVRVELFVCVCVCGSFGFCRQRLDLCDTIVPCGIVWRVRVCVAFVCVWIFGGFAGKDYYICVIVYGIGCMCICTVCVFVCLCVCVCVRVCVCVWSFGFCRKSLRL